MGAGIDAVSSLTSSVGSVAAGLGEWYRANKRMQARELPDLKKELADLYEAGAGRSDYNIIKFVEDRIDEVLAKQEVLWRQSSRALWLKAGDNNTKKNSC
ncbi:hypothetical protein ACOSP7_014247 [Xanthoceras sorbifolium]